EIAPGGVVEVHDGNYSEMVKRKKERLAPSQAASAERDNLQWGAAKGAFSSKGDKGRRAGAAAASPGAGASPSSPSKKVPLSSDLSSVAGGARRPDRAAERRRLRNQRILSDLEEAISRLEEEIRTLDISLADPDVYRDGEKVRGVKAARETAKRTLEAKLWDWEETSRKLETGEVVPA
ncbi:MAG TPA: ABC transporter C-terminal domain-containing protein, partial [Thermoanaerobaculia bacterium]|nr:ABC transporter C-terminal domain-containing protein [Thermoanaerobaculia bacterium]